MSLEPNAIYKCKERYIGKNGKGNSFILHKGINYLCTEVDMSQLFPHRKDKTYFLRMEKKPDQSLPQLTEQEFSELEGKYLEKI